jgi:hypothetical protein
MQQTLKFRLYPNTQQQRRPEHQLAQGHGCTITCWLCGLSRAPPGTSATRLSLAGVHSRVRQNVAYLGVAPFQRVFTAAGRVTSPSTPADSARGAAEVRPGVCALCGAGRCNASGVIHLRGGLDDLRSAQRRRNTVHLLIVRVACARGLSGDTEAGRKRRDRKTLGPVSSRDKRAR